MTERPIPFTAPMVHALLAGTKTQTRRIVHPAIAADIVGTGKNVLHRCPYGQAGDQLWVREAWRVSKTQNHRAPSLIPVRALTVMYDAGGSCSNTGTAWEHDSTWPLPGKAALPKWAGKSRPGMFMVRWASRIQLEVTAVRVERLCDITTEDAMDEGYPRPRDATRGPLRWYRDLWIEINDEASWHSNPWVWVVEFKRIAP